jgi:hypothetical protein
VQRSASWSSDCIFYVANFGWMRVYVALLSHRGAGSAGRGASVVDGMGWGVRGISEGCGLYGRMASPVLAFAHG